MEKEREKPVPREPAPEVTPRDDVRVAASPVRCPYCHADVAAEKSDWVACKSCLARHHVACWKEGTRCATCGGATCLGDALQIGAVETVTTSITDVRNERPIVRKLWVGLMALSVLSGALFTVLAIQGEVPSEMPIIIFGSLLFLYLYTFGHVKKRESVRVVKVEHHREGPP